MKKTLTPLLTLAMLFTLAACGSSAAPSKGEKEEIIVFAAASMTETLNQVKDVYETSPSPITLTPPVRSRPRYRRARTATSLSPPVKSR